jgi:tetratricopeptide (TPR) repeat protein
MEEQAGQISEQEKQTRNEMLFTLSERNRGTLALIITPNERKRKELYRFLKDHLKEYNFFDFDLTTHTFTSLYRALHELLPNEILQSEPVKYLVSVTGLENSLYSTEDGQIEFSSLVAQLNFERELIFNQPYIILLWISEGFDRELQRKAPDLMHWMSKRFVFREDEGFDGMIVAEEAVEYGTVRKPGKIKERLDRIAELEETWEKLCIYNKDQKRLIKDKINLLRLLGKEYAAAFMFEKAEDAFQKALALDKKISTGIETQLLYEIGQFYYDFGRYEKSLEFLLRSLNAINIKDQGVDFASTYHTIGMAYQGLRQWFKAMEYYNLSLEWDKQAGNEYRFASSYHQIGRVFEEQGKWGDALRNYQETLEWAKKTSNEYQLGGTYHQIGMVFEKQKRWEEALENYREALEWKKKTGDEYHLGGTYHQIGRVFEAQGKREEALSNYQEALEWKKKTGNEYKLGDTYHQIGSVFEEQEKWEEAQKNYQLALGWYQKTDNEYEMAGSYHQMGSVEESRGELEKALAYYEKAIEMASQYNHPDLPMAQHSLERIRQKLSGQNSPNP